MNLDRSNRLQAIFNNIGKNNINNINPENSINCSSNSLPHTEAFKIRMRKVFLPAQDAKQYEHTRWWDLAFLKKYLELGITQRGLRIKKQCCFLDKDLLKEWRLLAEFCTIKWIKILVQQKERKLELAQQAKEKEALIQKFSTSCPYSKLLQVLNKNVKKDEDNLILKKTNKL